MELKKVLTTLAIVALGTAAAHAQSLTETFSYPDGSLVGAAGSPWTTNSGTAGQQNVVSGELFINDDETEDTIAPLSSSATNGIITATFQLRMDPADIVTSAAGNYIMHFVASDDTFLGRVFMATNPGGPAGSYRIGVSTASTTATFFSGSFTTGTNYNLSLSYNFTTNTASLSEGAHGTIVAADAVDNNNVNRFGFRQSTTHGDVFIDNLSISTSAIPEPATSALFGIGLLFGAQRLICRKRS